MTAFQKRLNAEHESLIRLFFDKRKNNKFKNLLIGLLIGICAGILWLLASALFDLPYPKLGAGIAVVLTVIIASFFENKPRGEWEELKAIAKDMAENCAFPLIMLRMGQVYTWNAEFETQLMTIVQRQPCWILTDTKLDISLVFDKAIHYDEDLKITIKGEECQLLGLRVENEDGIDKLKIGCRVIATGEPREEELVLGN